MAARNRFPDPQVVRLTLPDESGDWIEIKKQLTVGEQKDITLLSLREIGEDADGRPKLTQDFQLLPFAKAVVYLVGWSFHNAKGPVRLEEDQKKRLAQFRALDPESWGEVLKAIEKHEQEIAEAKKPSDGTTENVSSSTSAAA